jgi:hypothetical protein
LLSHQVEDIGEEYINFLTKEGIFAELITFLFKEPEGSSSSQSSGQKN